MHAYCTYVRPVLEYGAFVWSPYTKSKINKLKSVQRRAARYVMSGFNRYISFTVGKFEEKMRYSIFMCSLQNPEWAIRCVTYRMHD